jgi:hypothetical protein
MNNMTKTIFCSILFSQVLFGYSKGNYLFPGIAFNDIAFQEMNKDSTLKIIKGLKEYKRIFGLADIYDTVNHFYLSDIDGDKKNELIYYGLISAEGKWSIIWKIDHQNYYLFGELFGGITGVSDSSYLATIGSGCLGSDFDYANLYRIMEDGVDFLQSTVIFNRVKSLNSLYLRSAMISNGVKIPDSLPIKKNILINKTGYWLRAQPCINDKPDSTDMQRYGILRGNTIVELNKATVASVTAMHKDNNGTIWWFLVLDNPQEAKYNVYQGYKKEKRRICGWISTKDLDYKEIK